MTVESCRSILYDDYPSVIYYYYFPFTKTSYSFAPREERARARSRLSSPSTILRLARQDRPHPEFLRTICSCPFAAAHHNKRFLFFVPLLNYAPLPPPPPPVTATLRATTCKTLAQVSVLCLDII